MLDLVTGTVRIRIAAWNKSWMGKCLTHIQCFPSFFTNLKSKHSQKKDKHVFEGHSATLLIPILKILSTTANYKHTKIKRCSRKMLGQIAGLKNHRLVSKAPGKI